MTPDEKLNLPLDFGTPDEDKLSSAKARGDLDAMGLLYAQGMPMEDPDLSLQGLVVSMEEGSQFSREAANGFAVRIYKSLAMTDLQDDPLSQNALYQMTLNAMDQSETIDSPVFLLVSALGRLPYTRFGEHSLIGTVFEAAADRLDDVSATLADTLGFAQRFEALFPGNQMATFYAKHQVARHFERAPTIEATTSVLTLLLHPDKALDDIKSAFCKARGAETAHRVALEVLLHFADKILDSEKSNLRRNIDYIAEVGFDVRLMMQSLQTRDEFLVLNRDLELDRKHFDPQRINPHITDHLLSSDLGL